MPALEDFKQLPMEADSGFPRTTMEKMPSLMMELEVEAKTNAAKYERAGEVDLAVPKARGQSCCPSFIQPRRMADKALVSVIQEAHVNGVSTRKIDRLVEDLGISVDKSAVSRRFATAQFLEDIPMFGSTRRFRKFAKAAAIFWAATSA